MPRSKFFRVATEGATTDGRNIDKAWIVQAAKNFDVKKYSPRVWLEHMRAIFPDHPARAYGDVLALEAREVEGGKMALFAQIDPTPDLIELNKKRQKIFTSIEINPNFAGSGEAYLVGLAVTDSPASLGTEALKFSAQHKVLDNRKQAPENVFSEAVEFNLEMEEEAKDSKSLFDIVKELFSSHRKDTETAIKNIVKDDIKNDFAEAVKLMASEVTELEKKYAQLQEDTNAVAKKLDVMEETIKKFKSSDDGTPQRPEAIGGATMLAQC